MELKLAKVLRDIARIALVLCGVALLGLGIFFTYKSLKYKPYKVRVSNVTDSAFTVSWVTDEPMVGVVYYGDKDSFLPGPLAGIGKGKAVDDRDVSNAQIECVSEFNKKASKTKDENFTVDIEGYDCNSVKVSKRGEYYTHHVTVQNLDAEKEYYFRVGDGYISYAKGKTDGVEYIEGEMPTVEVFSQKTLPVINDVSSPNPAYGTSYNFFYSKDGQMGMKKNFDSVIFLRTYKDSFQYPLMSAVTNSDGGWSVDYANVRDSEGKTLNMENAYVEFIPQVENAKPGASGASRYEDTNYPLDLAGNDLVELDMEFEKGKDEVSSGLLEMFVSGVHAQSCYNLNDTKSSCRDGYNKVGTNKCCPQTTSSTSKPKETTSSDKNTTTTKANSSVGTNGDNCACSTNSCKLVSSSSCKSSGGTCYKTTKLCDLERDLEASSKNSGSENKVEKETKDTSGKTKVYCGCKDGYKLYRYVSVGKNTMEVSMFNPFVSSVHAGASGTGSNEYVLSNEECRGIFYDASYHDEKCTNEAGEECIECYSKYSGQKASFVVGSNPQNPCPSGWSKDASGIKDTVVERADLTQSTEAIEACGGKFENGALISKLPDGKIESLGCSLGCVYAMYRNGVRCGSIPLPLSFTCPSDACGGIVTLTKSTDICRSSGGCECNITTDGDTNIKFIRNNESCESKESGVLVEDELCDKESCLCPSGSKKPVVQKDESCSGEVGTGIKKSSLNDFLSTSEDGQQERACTKRPLTCYDEKTCDVSYYCLDSCPAGTSKNIGECRGESATAKIEEGEKEIYKVENGEKVLDVSIINPSCKDKKGHSLVDHTVLSAGDCGTVGTAETAEVPPTCYMDYITSSGVRCDRIKVTGVNCKPKTCENMVEIPWEAPNSGSLIENLSYKSLAQTNNIVSGGSMLLLPESGMYKVETAAGDLYLMGGNNWGHTFYYERNGVEGYQEPADPNNPKENEDRIVNQSAVVLSTSKATTSIELKLKKGINIISFNFVPSFGDNNPMVSTEFLEFINQDEDKISRIAYFGAGQWDGGTSYDFDTEKAIGVSFTLSPGKGNVIVSEVDETIEIPGYNLQGTVPVAFSSGWNLIGVHGYDTQYTANSLINSINSTQGLTSNNVTYWPTSKGMYQGYQLSGGQSYGQDFSISKDLGYFVRISEFNAPDDTCKSIIWNPGGDLNGECGSNN